MQKFYSMNKEDEDRAIRLLRKIGYDNNSITYGEKWIALEVYKLALDDSKVLDKPVVLSGNLPLTKDHQCFELGHNMYLMAQRDNGRSLYGIHKCSRCGHEEHFQYDHG